MDFFFSSIIHMPLFWLILTLLAYVVGEVIQRRAGGHALLNPVLLAALLISALLMFSGTDNSHYRQSITPLTLLLGPATVALAVPLAAAAERIRQLLFPLLLTLVLGIGVAIGVTMLIAHGLHLSAEVRCAVLPRSITTPIAMGVAEAIGAVPTFTAALVIATGIIGAVIGPVLLQRLRVRDPRAVGFALGMGGHGIGAAQALRMHAEAGALAGLALGLHGFVGALVLPLLAGLAC